MRVRFVLPRVRMKVSRPVALFLLLQTLISLALIVALPTTVVIPRVAAWEVRSVDLRRFGIPFATGLPLRQGLDIRGGTQVTLALDMSDIPGNQRQEVLTNTEEVIRRRVDLFGVAEPRIRTSVFGEEYQLLVELPGIDEPTRALELIGKTARLEFREFSALDAEGAPTEEGTVSGQLVGGFVSTGLGGEQLRRASVQFDQNTNQPVVALEFDSDGAQAFADITTRNVGNPVGIFLDESIVSAPTVNEPIYGGNAVISGQFTLPEAKTLAAQLNAGALPVTIQIVAQNTIGPSLGQSAMQASILAGAVGLGLVALFMILLYGTAGVFAVIGLVAYAILTVAVYKLIPVTLTLPGIAGLTLSIGMAVDANILTLERMKEERRKGASWERALKLGFGRSWDSIKDANLATLAVCAVLFNPFDWGFLNTSGPVRGFAVTLALGIFISLLTGVLYSRTLLQLFWPRQERS